MRVLLLAALLVPQDEELARLVKEQRPEKLNLQKPPEGHPSEHSAVMDGAVFLFHRYAWPPRAEKPLGTVFSTNAQPRFDGELEWSVAGIRDDRNIGFETCDLHSPGLVFMAVLPPLPCTVTLKGTRRWYCDVPVTFKDPVEGATRRIGKFTLTVRWPAILVTSEEAVAEHLTSKILPGWLISPTLKAGVERQPHQREPLVPRKGVASETPRNPAWCGCPGKPTRGERPPAPTTKEWKVASIYEAKEPVENIDSISLRFRYPVEETFEVMSPPLK